MVAILLYPVLIRLVMMSTVRRITVSDICVGVGVVEDRLRSAPLMRQVFLLRRAFFLDVPHCRGLMRGQGSDTCACRVLRVFAMVLGGRRRMVLKVDCV